MQRFFARVLPEASVARTLGQWTPTVWAQSTLWTLNCESRALSPALPTFQMAGDVHLRCRPAELCRQLVAAHRREVATMVANAVDRPSDFAQVGEGVRSGRLFRGHAYTVYLTRLWRE